MLGWLVDEHGIEPHIPVFDKSQRTDGTFSRDDFVYDHEARPLHLPCRKPLATSSTFRVPRSGVERQHVLYRASKRTATPAR